MNSEHIQEDLTYQVNPEYSYKKSTIISVGTDKVKSPKRNHYIDNESFYNALLERRQIIDYNIANGIEEIVPITEFIGECFFKIANQLSKKYNFVKIAYKDEMISDAMLQCCSYINTFDVYRGKNPFSFFTQTVYYSFINRIDKEKLQVYYRFKSSILNQMYQNNEEQDCDNDSEDAITISQEYADEYIDTFVSDIEARLDTKKVREYVYVPKNIELFFEDIGE